jgi:hypothetical protein
MSVTIESYVSVDPTSPMSTELNRIDGDIEIVIGSARGGASAVRLLLDDAHTCRRLGRLLADAGDLLESSLSGALSPDAAFGPGPAIR